ncbi:MAG: DUF4304 domain-containing protein [Pannonibacter sp.]|jgi:hypothetical protein
MSAKSIISCLDRTLIPMGFQRQKATWNRPQDDVVEVIDIQSSKGGDRVTINAGVLSRSVYFACWGRDVEPFVEEPFCTVRARIGQLSDNKDLWWDVSCKSAIDEIAEHLERRIIPFLQRMRSPEEMREWLASTGAPLSRLPMPSICFAVLQSQLGNIDDACEVLSDLQRNALGGWKVKAAEVSTRIGYDSLKTGD